MYIIPRKDALIAQRPNLHPCASCPKDLKAMLTSKINPFWMKRVCLITKTEQNYILKTARMSNYIEKVSSYHVIASHVING